jgi:hypothetical protein
MKAILQASNNFMKNDREYPRYDIKAIARGDSYVAFFIDHDTGESWLLDSDLIWKKLRRSNKPISARRLKKKR